MLIKYIYDWLLLVYNVVIVNTYYFNVKIEQLLIYIIINQDS